MKNIITLRLLPLMGIVLSLMMASSCKHDPELPLNYLTLNDSICFDSQVLPVIESYCAISGCHDGSGEKRRLTSYLEIFKEVNPGSPNKSKLYQVMTASKISGNMMPPNHELDNSLITPIELWILEGAKNTNCSIRPCDSVNVTFTGTIMPIITTYCLGCHNGTAANTTLSLTTYNQVVAAQQNKFLLDHLLNRNGKDIMPKSGSLSICNIAQIKKWINDGMPQ